MVDEMVKSDGTAELAAYSPKMPPYIGNVQPWELKDVVAEFHHFTGISIYIISQFLFSI